MSDIIDQAINEANKATKVAEEAGQEPIQEASEEEVTEVQEPEQQETEKSEDSAEEEGEEVVFPKKAINALHRRDRKIAQRDAEIRELKAKLATLEQPKPQSEAESKAPNADDYDTFDDYLAALVDYRVNGKKQEESQKPQETQEDVQRQVYFQNRAQEMTKRSDEITTILPDFAQVRDMNADVLDSLPEHVIEAVLESDDSPLALYVLAKEGKLESLSQMSPVRAARELALAENRGQKYLQRTQTKAPAPIGGKSKPNPVNRGIESMSAEQLLNWARK